MRLKTIVEESFDYYRYPVFLMAAAECDFKCCKEAHISEKVCQNYPWSFKPVKLCDDEDIIRKYLSNPISKAVCFAGLEPLLQAQELYSFMRLFRKYSEDPIIIYTGYNRNEIEYAISCFEATAEKNVIVKFGRYVPGQKPHYDPVLGVNLASDNQYGEVIC